MQGIGAMFGQQSLLGVPQKQQIQNVLGGIMGRGMFPDLTNGVPSVMAEAPKKFEFAQHIRKNQTRAEGKIGKSDKSGALLQNLALDPTTAYLYCILWYLFQQFVRNNTTTDRILMRPPGAVAVADNLRITFWWLVMFGAICWLALLFVLVYLDHYSSDFVGISGVMGQLFAS